MAGDVTSEDATAPVAPAAPVEGSDRPLVERPAARSSAALPYPMRFRLAYFALAIVLGAGVGSFVLFLGWHQTDEQTFSAWKPTADGEARAWQIADHVSARYRHPSGNKLVAVLASPPVVQMAGNEGQREEIPIRAIVVRGRTRDFSDADIKRVTADDTLMFALCGGGERCMMDEGTPSRERGVLLRREVLELALYAYKYVEGVETVVALLPPVQVPNDQGQPTELQRLIYFRKSDLDQALDTPLNRLLPGQPALQMPHSISQRVDGLVLPRQFRYAVEPGQQGDALLILEPFVAS